MSAALDRQRIDGLWEWLGRELGGGAIPPFLVFIGLGDGAILDALDERAPGTRVLALEPDPVLARAFLDAPAWRAARANGRLVYLCDPDYAGADEAWRIFPAGVTAPTVVVHPDVVQGAGVARAAQQLKRIIFGVAANAEARRRFAPRYLLNSIRNVPAMVAGGDVRDLADAYRGVPAIIAGAGPSLDAAIEKLQRLPDRGLLIAADTALRPLLVNGLAPQLVVGLDPSTLNARHLLSLPECRNTWLVAESALDRQATAGFDDRTLWFRVSNHHPWPWLNQHGIDKGRLDVWGSVLTAAFQVACLAGCDPIVFVGSDLSFTGARPYARGTTYEFDWAWEAAAGGALDETWRKAMVNGEPRPDLSGDVTMTTGAMISVRDWLVARAARSGRRVINASSTGTLFGAGIEQASLSDALPTPRAILPVSTFARRPSAAGHEAVAVQARALRSLLAAGSSNGTLAQWDEFSGGGFDAQAVGAALDEAARGLVTPPTPPPPPLISWQPLLESSVGKAIVMRLPEHIVKMPSDISSGYPREGGEVDGRAADTDRAALLLHAWELLGRICDDLGRSGTELALSLDEGYVGHARLSALYQWPDTTRWAIELFEGLLGAAWPPVPSRPDDPFFKARVLPRLDAESQVVETSGSAPSSNAARACVLLVLEWLRCAGASPELCTALNASLVDDPAGKAAPMWLSLPTEPMRDDTERVDLRLMFVGADLVRRFTGVIRADANDRVQPRYAADLPTVLGLMRCEVPLLSAMFHDRPRGSHGRSAVPADFVVVPRVLTASGGYPRLFTAYSTADGVVCTAPCTPESVIVDEAGEIRPYRTWPRPIRMELALGDGGVVAWGNGLESWPRVDAPYVMYRRRAGDEIVIEELTVRPLWGQWVNGRLYWSCYSRLAGWQGLVSWAPGDGTTVVASNITSWAVFPDGEGLQVHPCDFEPGRGFVRRIMSEGWTWRPGHSLEPMALGRYGAASFRDTREGWTATAYPDADIVLLESGDGRELAMTCHCPLRLAWLGRSLLVSTRQGDLLLFEDLAARCAGARSASRSTWPASHVTAAPLARAGKGRQ